MKLFQNFGFFVWRDGSKVKEFEYDEDTWNAIDTQISTLIISIKEDSQGENMTWVYPIKTDNCATMIDIPFLIPFRESDTWDDLTSRVNQKISHLPYTQKTRLRLKKLKIRNKLKQDAELTKNQDEKDEEKENEEQKHSEQDQKAQQQQKKQQDQLRNNFDEGHLNLAVFKIDQYNFKMVDELRGTPQQIFKNNVIGLGVQFMDDLNFNTYGPHRIRRNNRFRQRM